MQDLSTARDDVLRELERVLSSRAFHGAGRSGALLRFLLERTLAGQAEQLKEYTVGAEALGRGESFDPRTDAIVRVEISRLRSRLGHYYATEGAANPVRIAVPKGSYAPVFESAPGLAGRRQDLARRTALMAVATAVVVLAILAVWFRRPAEVGGSASVTRLELDLGASVVMRSTQVGSSSVIISPDGHRLVFVSYRNQEPRLMTRVLNEIGGSESIELPGTAGVRGPFFSPDGRHLAFLSGKRLWKTRLDGGEPTVLCDAAELLGGSWGDDGSIVAALTATGLVRVSSNGGRPEPIAGTPVGARWPQVLPGSKAILFTAGAPGPGPMRIEALSLTDGTSRTLMEGVSYARYVASGHLAWVARQTLFVAPFDLRSLELTGPAIPVVQDVASSMYGGADFDVSDSGTLVFRRKPGGRASMIQWLDGSGQATPLLEAPAEYFLPSVSPDGSRLAFSLGETPRVEDFQILDLRSGAVAKPVTAGIRSFATWLPPDGRFLVGNGSSGEIRWMRTDGSEAAGTLLAIPDAVLLPWSFDGSGRRLAFYQRATSGEGAVTFDIWTVPVSVDGEALMAGTPEPFVVSDAFEFFPAFSPDGRWIAHVSLEEDAYQIYVRQFADSGRKWRVSDQGGTVAAWSADGRRLFYESLDHRIMSVDFRIVDGEFQPEPPKPWAGAQLADTGIGQSANGVTLVLNFSSEVKRQMSLKEN
jgi:serine/threonine-protein kinase